MPYSALSHLECSRTGERYDADQVQGVSAVGAPLLARYDLDQVRATVTRDSLKDRPHDLWRYHEVLPGPGPRERHDAGGGDDAAAAVADVRRGDRRTQSADEGRGPDPHRDVQGSRRRGRCLPGARAGRAGGRDADERQRGSGMVGVRRARRDGFAHRDAGRRPGDHSSRVRGRRCRALPRRRADQPRRRAGQGGGRGAGRLPGGLHAQGAVSHRGQEDDGLRDRRAARAGRCPT